MKTWVAWICMISIGPTTMWVNPAENGGTTFSGSLCRAAWSTPSLSSRGVTSLHQSLRRCRIPSTSFRLAVFDGLVKGNAVTKRQIQMQPSLTGQAMSDPTECWGARRTACSAREVVVEHQRAVVLSRYMAAPSARCTCVKGHCFAQFHLELLQWSAGYWAVICVLYIIWETSQSALLWHDCTLLNIQKEVFLILDFLCALQSKLKLLFCICYWFLKLRIGIACRSYFPLHGISQRKGNGWSGAKWVKVRTFDGFGFLAEAIP